MLKRLVYLCLAWLMISASLHAQQLWTGLPTGDITNLNAGNIGIGTNAPTAKVHIKGNKDWGLIIQNNNSTPQEPFNEATFMVREPLSDAGNFFSLVVGSGPASAVELSAIRASDGTGRVMDIRTGKWSWRFGDMRYINFDSNGVAAFGTVASTASGKQVEIRASTPGDDALRLQGIWHQTGKVLRVLDDFGSDIFNVSNNGNVGVGTANPTAKFYVNGNFVATGSKSALVETASYGKRKLYALESPENWFEDFGGANLRDSQATVRIDPIFAETINTGTDYYVFVTPNGDCLLSVSDKTPNSFNVKQLYGTDPNCKFDYRIVAKRREYENLRLEEVRAEEVK